MPQCPAAYDALCERRVSSVSLDRTVSTLLSAFDVDHVGATSTAFEVADG